MTYKSHFHLIDDVSSHLDGVVATVDAFTKSRYVGFYAVSATTVIELSVKSIITDFAASHNKILGSYISEKYRKLNAKVSIEDLNSHILPFGLGYKQKFKLLLDEVEDAELRERRSSIKSTYGNLLSCRHQFSHEGKIPTNSTYEEVKRGFEASKSVLHCLSEAMK